ncbi:MAG: hypothetical protein MJE63_12370 [Proteobacteria bacterium]|nr:hypothetical protein [Pseudomonadota bacterium]
MYDLTNRLPPEILSYDRWRELFEAIDEYWEQHVSEPVERLKNLRSVFTASEDDLTLMLEELSAYFDADTESSKPLSIFWKRNEINNKNSEAAVEALIQRIKISAKDVKFTRLYAPKDTVTVPYGTEFYTKQELEDMEVNMSDYFLSSHMILEINLDDVVRNDWDEAEINQIMNRYFEENVRPTHIVFDGLNFFLYSHCQFKFAIGVQTNKVSVCILKGN